VKNEVKIPRLLYIFTADCNRCGHTLKSLNTTGAVQWNEIPLSGSFVSRRQSGLSNASVDDFCILKGYFD
jgi:hypothetical protein